MCRAAWDYIPNPPRRSSFLGGLRGGGGGGLAVVVCSLPRGGGVAGGSSVWLGRKYPVASPGPVGPFQEEPRIRRGDSAIWYGMVWYGMVWYGMVWYGMVWYVVVVVVRAPSTCRREKLPDTLSMGRAQGSSRPASRWPGVCRQRPRGGGGGGGGAVVWRGGGARVEEGGATCGSYPGALPRCLGEGDPDLFLTEAGVGGLDGGTTCSGTCGAPIPLASGRRSPTTGEGAICLRAPEPHERGRGGALPVSRGACTAQLVRPWRSGVPVGPAQHSWCGPGVRGFLWGLHSTAGAALACGGFCGACTAQLVRPWRAGVSVGACTALLVRPWRAGVSVGPAQHSSCGPGVRGVSVGPAQHSWCGPGVRGFLWGLHSTAGAALACGGSCGACTAQLVRPWRAGGEGGGGGGRRSEGVGLGPPPAVGGPVVVLTSRREVGSLAASVRRKGREGDREGGAACAGRGGGGGGGRGRGVCARARGEGGRCARPPSVTEWPLRSGVRGRGWPKSAGEPGALLVTGGAADGDGARTPARRGRIPPSTIHGGESWWRRGECHTVPSRPNRTETGPAGGYRGGGLGWAPGLRGPGPGSAWAGAGGDRAGPRAAAGGGRGWRAVLARGRIPRGPRGLGEGPRGRPLLEGGGGGGVAPCPGDDGGPS